MQIEVETNLDEAMAAFDELELEKHVLTVANIMDYARYLHDMQGYYVFNSDMLEEIVNQKLEALDEVTDETIEGALQTAATEYVNFLTDHIEEFQPPLSPSEAPDSVAAGEPRKARRGHWADRTGNLAAGFRSQVDDLEVMTHDDVAPEPEEEPDPDDVADFP